MISVAEASNIKELARSLGFDLVTFTNVEVPEKDRDFFVRWCEEGQAGGMSWLARDPARRAEPRALFSEALGLITLGVSYFQGPLPPEPEAPAGRVARYAWGGDYHDVIGRRVTEFQSQLARRWGPDLKTFSALDSRPILERAFARRSGLGFAGKNTNLIAPRVGSWIFLTELLVNLELPSDKPVTQGCGACAKCMGQCPTEALAVPFQLDARECIAYHTIENRGWIPREFRYKMGSWIFGCDDCQDVCPFNARARETQWPEFRAGKGVGAWVSLAEILSLRTNERFKARFNGTPLLRPKRAGLLRNACIVAGNQREVEALLPVLEECLFHDPEPVVRGHAAWAFGHLPERARGRILDKSLKGEQDETVRREIRDALELSSVSVGAGDKPYARP